MTSRYIFFVAFELISWTTAILATGLLIAFFEIWFAVYGPLSWFDLEGAPPGESMTEYGTTLAVVLGIGRFSAALVGRRIFNRFSRTREDPVCRYLTYGLAAFFLVVLTFIVPSVLQSVVLRN